MKIEKIITTDFWNQYREKLSPGTLVCLAKISGEMQPLKTLNQKITELTAIRTRCNKSDEKITVPGIAILQFRNALFLTQGKFGRLLGLSRFTVSNWEHSRTNPSSKTSQKILDMLDQSVQDFRFLLRKTGTKKSSD